MYYNQKLFLIDYALRSAQGRTLGSAQGSAQGSALGFIIKKYLIESAQRSTLRNALGGKVLFRERCIKTSSKALWKALYIKKNKKKQAVKRFGERCI